jgi:hypothetical protein
MKPKRNQFQEIAASLDSCQTFQASRVECEHGSNIMNLIKSESRNKLKVSHLNNLMWIHSFYLEQNIIPCEVYKQWTRIEDGQIKLPTVE